MKILATGGPVHAHLDPVKIITNRFKGGMMAEIAGKLASSAVVTYLCTKGSVKPTGFVKDGVPCPEVVYHNGFEDYRAKVKELAPEMDAVVLGAAVVNLIPVKLYRHGMGLPGIGEDVHQISDPVPLPLKEKFPSHDYKHGDRIFMEWTIAPRIIDEVKAVMKRTAHLFGFKLLAGQSHDELIRAAYEVLLESRATCVFANDASTKDSLLTKYAVTKERGVHEMQLGDVADFILRLLEDEYYKTFVCQEIAHKSVFEAQDKAAEECQSLIEKHRNEFVEVEGGLNLGTVAVRIKDAHSGIDGNSFMTTRRGKHELGKFGLVKVGWVDHKRLQVNATSKATLNAPLLHWIFEMYSEVHSILHFHRQEIGLPTYPFAPPGTKRDSVRGLACKSFNIEGHGCFLLRNEKGEVIR